MLKGWHVCKASMALSINARCFADGAGTSNRGDDASVPSRLKEIRILMLNLSSRSIPAGAFEHSLTRSLNGAVQSSPRMLVSTGGAAKPPPSGPPSAAYCATASAMLGCSGACSVRGDVAGRASDDCFCFSGSVLSARTSSACVASGAGGCGVGSLTSRCCGVCR